MGMKGIVFTTDVMIGLSLIIVIILSFISLRFESILPEKKYERLSYFADDAMGLLSNLKVKGVRHKPTIDRLIEDGILTENDLNKTVLDLIASFWYSQNETIARNITKEVLEGLVDDICINLTIDTEVIYPSCGGQAENVAVSAKIETGYEVGKPAYGYIARAFLTSIKSKIDSSYVYFGGFVGEGNITRIITLPTFDDVLSTYMELDVGNNFSLYINGNFSGFYIKGLDGGGNLTADKWVVCNSTFNPSYCSYFKEGNNTLSFNFIGNRSFIGGGYFRVTYNTTQLAQEEEIYTKRYWFPGIHGFINLYSSFYVPGELNAMHIHLHYLNNYSTYLTIGNITVYEDNSTDERAVEITNETLSNKLDYKELSKKTVPIRMGTKAFSITKQGNADVVLITDVSGSMDLELNGSGIGIERACDDPNLYDPDTKRISLARCLDKGFVDIVLNSSGNRVALVSYRDNVEAHHDLSTNKTSLHQQIDEYEAEGGTCICCGINEAYEILETQSNASRQKFVIIMTDGIPSHKCANTGCEGTLTKGVFEDDCYGWGCCCPADPVTGAGCDTSYGWCSVWWIGCSKCKCMCEMQNANYSSCRVRNDLNATVDSIGFGPVSNCPMGNWTLRAIAECGNGSYYGSTNATELKEIYAKIAEKIVKISYRAQIIEVTGNLSMNNLLYPNSYIELNYTPTLIPFEYGEIELTRETDRLRNFTGDDIDIPYKEGWYNVSEDVKVVDAKITSYSSEFWTDRLYVKNSTSDWTRVYWLGDYGGYYQVLGDPYIVQIPVDRIGTGNNSVRIGTGLSPTNATGGSPDNRVIYTMRFKGSIEYGDVFNSSEIAVEDAVERLIDKVSTYVDVGAENIATENKTIGGIRWLWGPSLLKLIVWEK